MGVRDLADQDINDASTISWWADYARAERRPVSSYLLERGEDREIAERSVPASEFTSREFHDLEHERLWPRTWLMACRENEIPDVGDYLEYEIAGRSILIVRDAPDSVKAFWNACRHRGAAVASGVGNASCFSCPYHGWRYGLDGALQKIPAAWDFAHLNQSEMGLRAVQADCFDGWVFINMDPDAPSLSTYLGETVMRHFLVFPSAQWRKTYHYGRVVPANWKVITEAFMETYHIARSHPSIMTITADVQSQYDSFGLHHRLVPLTGVPSLAAELDVSEQDILDEFIGDRDVPKEARTLPPGMTARTFLAEGVRHLWAAKGVDVSTLSDADLLDPPLYLLFPNFMPYRAPVGHHAFRIRPGADPDHCLFELMWLEPVFTPEIKRDASLQMLEPTDRFGDLPDAGESIGVLLDQDIENCRLIQKGLRGLDRIELAQVQERNILRLHHDIRTYLEDDRAKRSGPSQGDR